MNKKGQITAIISFIAIVLIILFMAPLLMKIVIDPAKKFSDAIGTVDTTNKSVEAISSITGTFTRTFDWVVLFLFAFATMILLISAFLVDVHPAFLFVYIIACFTIMIFAPTITDMMSYIYSNSQFTESVSHLPMTEFVFNNFGVVIVGIIVISGLIMFGKYRFGSTTYGTTQ